MFFIDAIKYFFTTPYADIRIARAEYREIKQQCQELKRDMLAAQNRLCVDETAMGKANKKCVGCIQSMVITPQLDYPYDSAENKVPYISYRFCDRFKPEQGPVGICMNFVCSHVKLNHDYFMAMKKYQHMRQRCRQFWRDTIVRHK